MNIIKLDDKKTHDGFGCDFLFYKHNGVGVKVASAEQGAVTKTRRARRVQVLLARYDLAPKVSRRLYMVVRGKQRMIGFVTEVVDTAVSSAKLPKKVDMLFGDTHAGNVREKDGKFVIIDTGYHLLGDETGGNWETAFKRLKARLASYYNRRVSPYLENY